MTGMDLLRELLNRCGVDQTITLEDGGSAVVRTIKCDLPMRPEFSLLESGNIVCNTYVTPELADYFAGLLVRSTDETGVSA
jgi:hypothetical protein